MHSVNVSATISSYAKVDYALIPLRGLRKDIKLSEIAHAAEWGFMLFIDILNGGRHALVLPLMEGLVESLDFFGRSFYWLKSAGYILNNDIGKRHLRSSKGIFRETGPHVIFVAKCLNVLSRVPVLRLPDLSLWWLCLRLAAGVLRDSMLAKNSI